MALRKLSAADVNRLTGSAPVRDQYKGRDIITIPEQAANFLQGIEPDDPEPLVQALRHQFFDFVTALLDFLEQYELSGDYMPLNHPILRTLVGEFGWEKSAVYPLEDPDSPGQAYRLKRSPWGWENHFRTLFMKT